MKITIILSLSVIIKAIPNTGQREIKAAETAKDLSKLPLSCFTSSCNITPLFFSKITKLLIILYFQHISMSTPRNQIKNV